MKWHEDKMTDEFEDAAYRKILFPSTQLLVKWATKEVYDLPFMKVDHIDRSW